MGMTALAICCCCWRSSSRRYRNYSKPNDSGSEAIWRLVAMPETPTASDLEKAHLILSEFGLLIGPAGEMSDIIARAVAAGIALGRKEALAEKRGRKE